jgi:hypothetical protein
MKASVLKLLRRRLAEDDYEWIASDTIRIYSFEASVKNSIPLLDSYDFQIIPVNHD